MNVVSLTFRGQATADFRVVGGSPSILKLLLGLALTRVRRFLATHPASPSPSCTVVFRSCGASTPDAKRHLRVSPSPFSRNRALPDHGMMFISFDEMSAIVSATP